METGVHISRRSTREMRRGTATHVVEGKIVRSGAGSSESYSWKEVLKLDVPKEKTLESLATSE